MCPELPFGKTASLRFSPNRLRRPREGPIRTATDINFPQDVYPRQAASVTAALAVLRSLAGALLPLCALDMYAALSMGWGNSTLAFISLGLVPIPLLFYAFGARIVKKFQVQL